MITPDQYDRLTHSLPILQQADQRLKREFMQSAYFARIPANKDVFVEGDHAGAIALLLSGVVRVYKIGETGREITLYRFGAGESCVLTANAILSDQTFPALATVQEDAEAIMIPAATFRSWVGRSDLWRSFVFDLLSQRIATMLAVVDEVTFRRMDSRLAALLLHRGERQNPIRTTHQELAAELGSSREVISRLLADLSAMGCIHPSRGAIQIIDSEILAQRAAV